MKELFINLQKSSGYNNIKIWCRSQIINFKKYWYLIFGVDIILLLVLLGINVSYGERFDIASLLKNGDMKPQYIVSLVFFLISALLKTISIHIYTEKTVRIKIRLINVLWRWFYYFLSFFMLYLLYLNYNKFRILSYLLLNSLIYILDEKLITKKVYVYIFTDFLTIFVSTLIILFFPSNSLDGLSEIFKNFFGLLLSVLLFLLRYILIAILSNGLRKFTIKGIWLIDKECYVFSEVYSTILFLISIISFFDFIKSDGVIWGIALSIFVYSLFLYFRIWLYDKYGLNATDVKEFLVLGIVMCFYILFVNAVKMNIVVWIIPLMFNIITTNLEKLSSNRWEKYRLKVSKKFEKFLTRINLWLCLTLFVNYLFSENKTAVLRYSWFKTFASLFFQHKSKEGLAFQIGTPIFSVLVGLLIFNIVSSLLLEPIIKNRRLVQRQERSSYLRYHSVRRLKK